MRPKRSRVHPNYKMKYAVANWRDYESSLGARGNNTKAENAAFRFKTIIGQRMRARSLSGQEIEALLTCNILNTFFELGRPDSIPTIV